MVLGFEGTAPPKELAAFAARFGLAGVILFRKNCPDAETVRRLIAGLRRELADADPGWRHLVFVDQEGGRVERIPDEVPHLPAARELGGLGDADLEALVRSQAAALRRVGVDVNLAPVCDVLQEGESGDIGDRSFGSDAVRVGRSAAAYIRGTMAAGVCPCAKHFPGLGPARVNSHLDLPVVGKTREQVDEMDLPPFRAVIQAGVPLVMAAHAVYPCRSDWPVSLSGEWLTGVLRESMGFRGAVISDDMEMGALRTVASPEEAAVRAARAGCDLLIYSRMLRSDLDPVRVAEALEKHLGPEEAAPAALRLAPLFETLDAG